MAMKIHFMWVGQGDCTIIETNAGQADNKIIMIDCGSIGGVDLIYQRNIKPTLTTLLGGLHNGKPRNKIDYLFLTHPDRDHYNMIHRLLDDKFEVKEVFYGGLKKDYEELKKWKSTFLPDDCYEDYHFNFSSQKLVIGNNASRFKLWVLSANYPFISDPRAIIHRKMNSFNLKKKPGKKSKSIVDGNGCSLVILIQYGNNFRAMFTGDATSYQQEQIWAKYYNAMDGYERADPTEMELEKPVELQSKIFKMAHHGSKENCVSDFVDEMINPDAVLASARIHSRYGHPSYDAISSITLKNTNQHKWVYLLDNINNYVGKKSKGKTNYYCNYKSRSTSSAIYTTQTSFFDPNAIVRLKTPTQLNNRAKTGTTTATKKKKARVTIDGANQVFTVKEDGTYSLETKKAVVLDCSPSNVRKKMKDD